ncbi:MAG: type II toxin-antitoxin system HicB family antitoxin [Gallionella sp.]|nr:type II toxin-antitoxin system HicB family antitoxin [Gallionella sp.]
MNDILEHKGYYGSVSFSTEDHVLFGKLLYIRALVSYEAETASGIEKAFHEAVDDYLDLCKAEGIKPEQPFKGSFNVRVGRDLHRQIALEAVRRGVSLNSLIVAALEKETHHAA